MVAEGMFWRHYSQEPQLEQEHRIEIEVGGQREANRVPGRCGAGNGRGWWWRVGRVARRRPYLTLTALTLTLITVFFLLYQLVVLITTYHEYLLALLPQSPLPVQNRGHTRPPTKVTVNGGGEEEVRVLCLISTSPQYHQTRAQHVAVTWARHCTKALFLTTQPDPHLPTLLTPGAESYDQLWEKVTQGFNWAYEHRGEYDWVVKADDDTFLLVENLRAALRGLDPSHPAATGVHLRTWETGSTYLNGGAGYVLSRGAVSRLVERGLRGRQCADNLNLGPGEDVNMADCLTFLGIELLDSRDSRGRQRFHIYPPQEVVDPRQAGSLRHLWLKQISIYPYKFGYDELSDEVISFHYVDAKTMYLLYYLVYLVNPRGDRPSSPLHPPKQAQ